MSPADPQKVIEITAGFLLDQIRVGRGLLDFVDGLLLVAISQANVEAVMRDPALQLAHAAYDSPPPDSLRRPISVHAIAQSLRLPFETVRRRSARLSQLGALRTTVGGIVVPTAWVRTPAHRQVAEAAYDRIGALRRRLALEGFEALPDPVAAWSDIRPVRAAARISAEYMLRLVDQLTVQLGDPVDVAVWLEVLRSNADEAGRRPVRGSVVARQLGLAAETVRRRAAHLVSIGACELGPNGLIVPQEVLARPEFVRILDQNLRDLQRLYGSLAELGRMRPAAQGRAAA